MRRRMYLLPLLAVLVLVRGAAAQAETTPPPAPVLPIEEQVQGTCRSPREAMLQLLYWIQPGKDRVDPERAARCMDGGELPADTVALRAEQLKRTLDARGLHVDIDTLPSGAEFTDAAGVHRWRFPDLKAVEIVRSGDRWVFSPATVRAIPGLHAATVPPLLERILGALPAWFHQELLGIAVWQLFGVLFIILVALTLQKIVAFVISTYLRRIAGRLALRWVDQAMSRIARPIGGLAMAGVFYVSVPWLQLAAQSSQIMRIAAGTLASISVAWLFYRLIDVFADWLELRAGKTESRLDDQLVPLVRKTLKVFTAVIGTLFVLQNLDVDVGSLLAGLGLGGLAFALAARDTVANVFGSLVVFIDRPFQIGDWVVIGGVEGLIEEVGFRTTRIRTFYNSLVTMPNAKMTDTAIDNYGARKYRRYVANLKLPYETPPERIAAFCEGIRAIIQRLPQMRRDYAIVEVTEMTEPGPNVMVYCFMESPDWAAELRTRTALNLEMMKLAAELGVTYATSTRRLHIESQALPKERAPGQQLDAAELAAIVRRFGAQEGTEAKTESRPA